MVGTRSGENDLEGLTLGLPRAITVDQVLADGELASLVAQLLDDLNQHGLAALVHAGEGLIQQQQLGALSDSACPSMLSGRM